MIAPVVAGALEACCWLPLGLAFALPLTVFLMMRCLRRVESSRKAVQVGLLFGAARYAVAAHFLLALVRFSPLAVLLYLMAILYILPFAILETWGALTLERHFGLPRAIGFGLLYVGLEKVRTLTDLSLPADQLSQAFGGNPAWLSWESWLGPFGITLLIMLTAAALDMAWEHRHAPRRAWAAVAVALILWAGPPLTDAVVGRHAAPEETGTLRVGIVQPSIDIREKFDRKRIPGIWARLERLTKEAARGADLVVWPESARPLPVVWKGPSSFRDPEVEALAARAGVPILYGCEIAQLRPGGSLRALYNGAAIAYPDGRPAQWYGKQRLLPFVEGVPFAHSFGWSPYRRKMTRSLLTLAGKFVPGPGPRLFRVGPARIGVLICFEGMYPQLGRAYRRAGANMLAILTNDAWWGGSAFGPWHARMVAARARELDLPVIRAANSGVSSETDARGRLQAATGLFEVRTLQVHLRPGPDAPTAYSRWGDWVLLLLFVAPAAAWAWTRLAAPRIAWPMLRRRPQR